MKHETVLKSISSLEEFGLDRKEILKNLSIFSNPCLFKTLDKLIEFGLLNYTRKYNSILKLTSKDHIFYRMAIAKKFGLPLLVNNETLSPTVRLGSNNPDSPYYNSKNKTNEGKEKEQKRLEKILEITEIKYFDPEFDSKACDQIIDKIDSPITKVWEGFRENHRDAIRYLYYFDSLVLPNSNQEIKQNEFEYHIDDIIISRKKVLRNYFVLIKNGFKFNKDLLLYSICKDSILTPAQVKKIIQAVYLTHENYKANELGRGR